MLSFEQAEEKHATPFCLRYKRAVSMRPLEERTTSVLVLPQKGSANTNSSYETPSNVPKRRREHRVTEACPPREFGEVTVRLFTAMKKLNPSQSANTVESVLALRHSQNVAG